MSRRPPRGTAPPAQPDLFDAPAAGPEPSAIAPASAAPDAAAVLAQLAAGVDAGWLRALDRALAAWLVEQAPRPDARLALAGALLARAEGRGHLCLDLAALLGGGDGGDGADGPGAGLDGPPEAAAALQALIAALGADRAAWTAALDRSGAVAIEGDEAPGLRAAPLVRHGALLYLRRHHRDEVELAAALRARAEALVDAPPVAAARVAAVLAWLFPPLPSAGDAALDWQRAACAIAARGRLTLITGGPGTGKTYTVARLLALVQALHGGAARGLRIALAAPTGKAAARLQQSLEAAIAGLRTTAPAALDWDALAAACGSATTLHQLLGARPDTRALKRDAEHPLEVDLLVVDEASMVHLGMMAALQRALPPQARLVLLGDRDQLASVEAGAVLADLCDGADIGRVDTHTADWIAACTGQAVPEAHRLPSGAAVPPLLPRTVLLRHSHRFAGAIGALARAVNAGDGVAVRAALALPPAGAHRPGGLVLAADGSVATGLGATPAQAVQLALHGRADPGAPPAASHGVLGLFEVLARRPDRGAGVQAHAAWVRAALEAFDRSRLLCALREGEWGVSGFNAAIEAALRQRGLLRRWAGGTPGEGPAGAGWYEGRPVMVTRNDAALGVFNGDIGLALRGAEEGGDMGADGAPDEPLRVWFADPARPGGVRGVMASRLAAIETAWAMTVHKSQGSEFAHTLLALPPQTSPVLTRELVYTGLTRARSAFTLLLPEPGVLDEAVRRRTRRTSGLAGRLGAAPVG